MPGRFELKPLLEKIWHAPDNLRILDPLPLAHRRIAHVRFDAVGAKKLLIKVAPNEKI